MTETNFKHTDLGLIPHDWEVKTLEDYADILNGDRSERYPKDSEISYSGIPFINAGHIVNGQLDFSKMDYISIEKYNSMSGVKLKINDLLVCLRGSLGKNAKIDFEGGTVASSLCVIRPYAINPNYLSSILNSSFFDGFIKEENNGSSQPNLSAQSLLGFKCPLPPTLAEQERIAGALSSIETLIGALTEQIEKKRHIKQGAMQQLLTGKKRLAGFTGEWKSVKLDDLLDYEQPTRYLVQSTEYTEQGTPVLTAGKTFILGYTTEGCGIFDKLPVIIFDDFVVESKYVTFPFKVKSSAMKMLSLRDKANNLRFIYEKMQCIDFPIADHKRHWISEYSQIEITLPEPAEQSAIAAVLSRMDTEIAALEQKRDKYIAVKSGMMQNLLTGKIRLV